MNIRQLLELEPISISNDLCHLYGFRYNHVPEIQMEDMNLSKNERVTIKHYADFCFDGRRVWCLASVWLDEKPVMVIQNAGREGDDYAERFVIDKSLYINFLQYIRSLDEITEEDVKDFFDIDVENPKLTNFYSQKLEDFYDVNFVPEYKPGDRLTIMAPLENPRGYIFSSTVMVPVEVEIAEVFNIPYSCYRVKETQRKIKYGRLLEGESKVLAIKDIPPGEEKSYSEIWLRLNKNLKIAE